MSDKKLIAVIGATGAQGGGLARAILADPEKRFALRAITRNPQSEKAAPIRAQGAEVVAADLDDVESLRRAFQGAHGAFCVTNFWEHLSPEKEFTQASNLAQAAKDAGVKHAIWSTLEDSRRFVPLTDDRMPTLMGKYKVPHFDAKGEADGVFRSLGVPTTYFLTSFYWENFIYFGLGPKRGADGVLGFGFPAGDTKLPSIGAECIGHCAFGVFAAGDTYIGKTIGVAGDHVSGNEMAAGLTKALGETVRFHDIPPEVFRGFGFPGADDLANMFQFNRDFTDAFRGARDLALARRLYPKLQNFETWIAANGSRIPTA